MVDTERFAKVRISTLEVLAVLHVLPEHLLKYTLADLADMAWAGEADVGYWPIEVVPIAEAMDQDTHDVVDGMPVPVPDRRMAIMTQHAVPLPMDVAAQRRIVREAAAMAAVEQAVEAHLDDIARERRYSGIVSLCSYANSAHPRFGSEARVAVQWRDAVWEYCYQQLALMKAGERADRPTPEQFVAEVKRERPMEWPTPT